MIRTDSLIANSQFSSPPKSPPWENKLPPMQRCAMCGSRRIHRHTMTVKLAAGGSVDGIEADECATCGEQFFDPAATTAIITAARKAGRRQRNA